MQCDQFREIADSYIGNELSVESNHAVNSHMEHCPDCRTELAARRQLRTRLREAYVNSAVNRMRPEFPGILSAQLHNYALSQQGSVRASLSDRPPRFSLQTLSIALAACLVLVAGISLLVFHELGAYEKTRQEQATISQRESNSGKLLNLVKIELAKSAVGDHRDCAIHFRLAEKPTDLEASGRKYDPAYINLTAAVLSQGSTPPGTDFVEAHSCVFEGRRFAHIVFKYHGRLVSFLVTDNGETLETKQSPPQSGAQSQVISCSQFDGYQVSCFQTARHAIFVVSDLPEGENLAVARALEPFVVAHITRTERTT